MINYGEEKRGHHIESFELLLQKKIKTDCHNYCIADHTYLPEKFTLKNFAQITCKKRNAALIEKNGNKAEDNSVAES